ncbi:MAG: twin-arginine translocation signal domain-containing protein [Rhodopirellula sp.]|nr:twin-arginine translocation signal domain-containing protein [Rhodopirellula sp.]
MELSRRGFIAAGAAAAASVAPAVVNAADSAVVEKPKAGELNNELLGTLLKAMGLKPDKVEERYDFIFRSIHDREEWDLSMTAVMSADNSSIWVMAWLDDLPKSAADVPRSALLRLLAANDRLGKGKFFAYVASNRRFVLQRVVPNQNVSTRMFADVLKDLGASVVESYPQWSTAAWSSSSAAPANVAAGGGQPAEGALNGAGKAPTRTATAPGPTKIQ